MTLFVLLATRTVTDPRCSVVLDRHQHRCHTFMIFMVSGLVGLALALPRRSKAGASPFGRHGSRSLIPPHRGVNQRAALACGELRRRERHGLGHRLQLGFIGFRQIGGREDMSL